MNLRFTVRRTRGLFQLAADSFCPKKGIKRLLFPINVRGFLVLAEGDEARVAKVVILGPLYKFKLADEDRSEPTALPIFAAVSP